MQNFGKKIFDLPVYRSTSDKYYTERGIDEDKFLRLVGLDPVRHKDHVLGLRQSLFERWGPWTYNEAIGWIKVTAETSRIIGILYLITSRVTKVTRNKRVFQRGKLFEIYVFPEDASASICKRLKNAIVENVGATGCLRGRYIDFEALDSLGPHIDWHSLMSPQFRNH